jgi:hypothetical protein
MSIFRKKKKSKIEQIVEPLSQMRPTTAAKSGVKAVAVLVGTSLLSTLVSAFRQRKESM